MNIKVRRLKLSDAVSIAGDALDKDLRDNLPYPKRSVYKNDTLRYVQKYIRMANDPVRRDREREFAIEGAGGRVLGTVSLMKISDKTKKAEVGYWIIEKYRGKGIAKKSLKVLIGIAFDKMKLKKLTAEVNSLNVASRHILEGAGFTLYKTIEKDHKIDSVWTDQLFYRLVE